MSLPTEEGGETDFPSSPLNIYFSIHLQSENAFLCCCWRKRLLLITCPRPVNCGRNASSCCILIQSKYVTTDSIYQYIFPQRSFNGKSAVWAPTALCSFRLYVRFPVLFAIANEEGGPGRRFIGLYTRRPSPLWWLQQWRPLNPAGALYSFPWVPDAFVCPGCWKHANICDGNVVFPDTISKDNPFLYFVPWKHYGRLVSRGCWAPKDKHEWGSW